MFKLLRKFLFALFILVVILVLARNSIGAWIAESSLKKLTSFPVTIGYLNIALTQPYLIVRDITIRNPKERYQESRAVKINLLESDYEPSSFLRHEPHYRKLTLEIEEVVAVKNAQGEINLKQLQKNISSTHKSQQKFKIDELVLSIGSVLYLDEKITGAEPKTYKLNVKNRIYKNVRSSQDIQKLVLNLAVQALPQNLGLAPQMLDENVKNATGNLEHGRKSILSIFKGSEEPQEIP